MLTRRRGEGCLAASRPKPGKREGLISWAIKEVIDMTAAETFLPDRRLSSLTWHSFVHHLRMMIKGRSILGRSIAPCSSAMASRRSGGAASLLLMRGRGC